MEDGFLSKNPKTLRLVLEQNLFLLSARPFLLGSVPLGNGGALNAAPARLVVNLDDTCRYNKQPHNCREHFVAKY